jgi:hypothetical protein
VNHWISTNKYDQNDALKANHMKSVAGLTCEVQLLFMLLLIPYISGTYTK